jgi:hypothetical protein
MQKLPELNEAELLRAIIFESGKGLQLKLIVPAEKYQEARELIDAEDKHQMVWSPKYDMSLEVGNPNEYILTQR